jgi:hypothetical protein
VLRPRVRAEVLWGYDMAMGGPATALALFFLVTLVIIAQLIVGRNRNTYYMITLVLAGKLILVYPPLPHPHRVGHTLDC